MREQAPVSEYSYRGIIRLQEDNKQSARRTGKGRAYLQDFHKTEEGGYRYEGAVYRADCSVQELQGSVTGQILLAGTALVFAVLAGCFPPAVMGSRLYILLPFAAELFFAFSLLYRSARIRMHGADGTLRAYIYAQTCGKLPLHAGLLTAFAGVTAGADLVWLILSKGQLSLLLLVWLILQAGVILLSIRFKAACANITWREE